MAFSILNSNNVYRQELCCVTPVEKRLSKKEIEQITKEADREVQLLTKLRSTRIQKKKQGT